MDMRSLSESDICTKFITPAVCQAGWDKMLQICQEVSFTKGRIIVRGQVVTRGKAKRADYIFYYKPNIPIAIIEAKDNAHSVGDGMQQALEYAETLNIPFVSLQTATAFYSMTVLAPAIHVRSIFRSTAFRRPMNYGSVIGPGKGHPEAEKIVIQDYFDDGSGKTPRYYQVNAINSAIEAIAKGQDRVLLVMATGTGKTYTAFQIIWRLWKARRKKRSCSSPTATFSSTRRWSIISAPSVGQWRSYPLGPKRSKRQTERRSIYRSPSTSSAASIQPMKSTSGFIRPSLDLMKGRSCSRISQPTSSISSSSMSVIAAAPPKIQPGARSSNTFHRQRKSVSPLPRRKPSTFQTSSISATPVFSYSLKEGIRDGFLAPYKVVKVHIDRDIQGYRPERGQLDRDGQEIEDRIYNAKDFDRTLVLDDRTKLVARKVSEFLKESGDPYQKTIVFCVDQEHAARMRQALINENQDLVAKNHRYVMRITGNDKDGQDQLGNFIDPENRYPVLVTTSRLLSTGVDAQTCRLIVLDREVGSMTEFKQIVGRGTRVHEDTGKYFFTLIDFRGATNHFADPDFDGEPVQIYEPGTDDPVSPPDDLPGGFGEDQQEDYDAGEDETIVVGPSDVSQPPNPGEKRKKIYVDGVAAKIVAERIEYLDENGKLVTESLHDYTKTELKRRFSTLDEFLLKWKTTERKQAILDEIAASGLPLDSIGEELGKDLDPFDLVCHIAFDQKPLTRRERADNVRKRNAFAKYGDEARVVLDALLTKYADEGVLKLDDPSMLKIAPFSALGTPIELVKAFGGRPGFEAAVREMQSALYDEKV